MSEIDNNYPVRDLIWVENEMPDIKRAVGTQYAENFIWRTYGTQLMVHLFFYPHFVPNGTMESCNQFYPYFVPNGTG